MTTEKALNPKTGFTHDGLKSFVRDHFEEFVNRKNLDIADRNFVPEFVDHGTDVPPGMPPGPAGAKAYVGGPLGECDRDVASLACAAVRGDPTGIDESLRGDRQMAASRPVLESCPELSSSPAVRFSAGASDVPVTVSDSLPVNRTSLAVSRPSTVICSRSRLVFRWR